MEKLFPKSTTCHLQEGSVEAEENMATGLHLTQATRVTETVVGSGEGNAQQ
jgi:hypothetical protein